jgi:RimJ/RimL family protein N-acetyltransferase
VIFLSGELARLHVLQPTDDEVKEWTAEVMRGLTTHHLFTGSYPMRFIDCREEWDRNRKAGDILFAVYNPFGKFVGTCGLHSHREIYRSWELRILIFDVEHVGKGLGTDAVTLLTDYAFRRLNAHRVWLGASRDNEVACKCYAKCGYKEEGVLRDELYYDYKWHHVIRFGVLENEWNPRADTGKR